MAGAKARLEELRQRQAELEEERDDLGARLSSLAASRGQEATLRAHLERFGRRLRALARQERVLVIRASSGG